MNILIACEFSGVVREAFAKRGHTVLSCDLLPTDQPCTKNAEHYQGDVFNVLDDGWDMMIAHPPCTYICNGGQANATRRPWLNWEYHRDRGIDFFIRLATANIDKKAIENPVGVMSSMFRKPDQIINPYQFGHEYQKRTCLWLEKLPGLIPTKKIDPPYKKLDFWSTKRNPNGRSLKSITFQGIADAMADQWG